MPTWKVDKFYGLRVFSLLLWSTSSKPILKGAVAHERAQGVVDSAWQTSPQRGRTGRRRGEAGRGLGPGGAPDLGGRRCPASGRRSTGAGLSAVDCRRRR